MRLTYIQTDIMVSWFYHALWCHVHANHSHEASCVGYNATLFSAIDVAEYGKDQSYFTRNPHQLFSQEIPFREIARSWGERTREDREAIGRIMNNSIDARILTVQYYCISACATLFF